MIRKGFWRTEEQFARLERCCRLTRRASPVSTTNG
jgi:hypothetical protein